MKNWLISPYSGVDTAYTLSTTTYHGVYLANLDNVNSMFFTIPALGEVELKANQQYREYFITPFSTISVRNPNACKFIVARLD